MVIDAHCHMWMEEWVEKDILKVLESVRESLGLKDLGNLMKRDAERLIADMDEAGIDKAVILPLDFEFLYEAGGLTYRDYNDRVGEALAAWPERLIAFAGVDPRRGKAGVLELRRCVEEMGFRGLKLWTITGFVPDDEAFYPLYAEAERLGITVMVHTGLGPGYSYLKTCRPVYVDKIAVDFRGLNFILAHVGNPWVDEALAVAMKNPNVWVDISAWQKGHSLFAMGLYQVLSQAKLMHGGVHKVLFGTDWPLFTEVYSQREWVEVIRGLEQPMAMQVMGLPEITPEEKEMILGGNARVALRLWGRILTFHSLCLNRAGHARTRPFPPHRYHARPRDPSHSISRFAGPTRSGRTPGWRAAKRRKRRGGIKSACGGRGRAPGRA